MSESVIDSNVGKEISPRIFTFIVNGSSVLTFCGTFIVKKFILKSDFCDDWNWMNWVLLGSFLGTSLKRVFEGFFVHKFTRKEPLGKAIGITAYIQFFVIPFALTIMRKGFRLPSKHFFYVSFMVWVVSILTNFLCHWKLRKMHVKKGERRKIPNGFLFNYVTCPHYLAEWTTWIGLSGMTGFCAAGIGASSLMGLTLAKLAKEKHKTSLEYFKDEYPKNRKAFIPFFL